MLLKTFQNDINTIFYNSEKLKNLSNKKYEKDNMKKNILNYIICLTSYTM